MRQLLLSVFILLSCFQMQAQVTFKSLQLSPQYPQVSQTVNFTFDASTSSLAAEEKVDIAVYLLNIKTGVVVIEPMIQKVGNLYKGSFSTDSTTGCIAFSISANTQKETNGGDGYIVPVYTSQKQPVKNYYLSTSQLYIGFGEYLLGMKSDADKGLALLEEGKKAYPELGADTDFLGPYLSMLMGAKKDEAVPVIQKELAAFAKNKKLSDKEYFFVADWYKRLKKPETADSLIAVMKKQYPDGGWKKNEKVMALLSEKDAAAQQKLLDEFIAANQPLTDNDKQTVQRVYTRLANAYKVAGKLDDFKKTAALMIPAERYSLYNGVAWDWAENNLHTDLAEQMAKEATEWTKNETVSPTEKKSPMLTQKAWKSERENMYAMYADTYAFILYNKEDYKTGLPYAKDAAELTGLKDAELNERYALLLEKAAPAEEAKKIIEKMVAEGKATEKSKEALKNVYTTVNKSATGFDTYIAAMEKTAKEKKRADIAKTKIKEAAPKFSLKDFEGNTVSLASLKGKVVVVDFWATWCGPCIASMPGMKMAEEKLKSRGDVAFLFIDTWENVEDKKQNAMNFMKKKNYSFHVLLDDENKVVTDYDVKGIPAKFIIDKEGNICFKATGFSGNPDELVEELSTMVEIAAM